MSKNEIIDQLTAGKLTPEAAKQLLAASDVATRRLTMKVSDKTGALSIYGLQSRFPVTLYAGQWERLLDTADDIRKFIKANESKLQRKGAAETAAA